MGHRQFDSSIKSLVHFDYPYFAEEGDGLNDEIGNFTWTRQGDAKLCGSQIPADEIIADTPYWGYRCLHTNGASTSHILGQAKTAITFTDILTASCWVRCASNSTGDILRIENSDGASLLKLTTGSLLVPAITVMNSDSLTADTLSLPLNTWAFLRLSLNFKAGSISLTVNGNTWTGAFSASSFAAANIRLGGFNGFIDEFMLTSKAETGIPSQPACAVLNIQDMGGFGTGELGNVTPLQNGAINSVATVTEISGKWITLSNIRAGLFGTFDTGKEIMLLDNETGDYVFRRIEQKNTTTLLLNETVNLTRGNDGVQCILVPNFGTFRLGEGQTLTPLTWDAGAHTGGVAVFRTKGDCTINGSILTMGTGRYRTDYELMRHSRLIDNFITGRGGGLFIACGGTFSTSSTARLGASWSGDSGQGVPDANNLQGHGGGAGYGGAGASDDDKALQIYYGWTGGYGGVGGGGGGYDYTGQHSAYPQRAGDAGTSGTGGWGRYSGGNATYPGGTQGVTPGGNAPSATREEQSTGGGGAGGESGSNMFPNRQARGAYPGANIILLAKTLAADSASISTGGEGGQCISGIDMGGGGTGFCYIAAEHYA